ncbi:MAG: hypothetical protein Hyperionvirus45_9 [Hyperionvirus sp.]|uniref:Uncharacterized protein n=1 Tax=Hyperionvirus sp. TaxID=2487770 RepID=A0A3G5ACG5_9VIRU|nr:MAG: hypothetical protein Hyperionvirus45_9 [Hyperionvirus sp.]
MLLRLTVGFLIDLQRVLKSVIAKRENVST